MKEREYERKTNPSHKVTPTTHPLTKDQLRTMSTDQMIKMLMSHELAMPMNASVRQKIIKILQEREGNDFVNRLLGKKNSEKKVA